MSLDMNEFGGAENIDALNVLIGEVTDGEGIEIPTGEPAPAPMPEAAAAPEAAPQVATHEQAPAVPGEPAPVVVDPNVPPPVAPSVDTAAILQQMQQQQEQMQQIIDAQNAQPQEQLTPEQVAEQEAIAELKQRMGLDKIEEQNEQLKQQLEQQQQIALQQQQAAYQAQVDSDINSLKAELEGFNPDLVAKELSLMANEPYMLPNGIPAMDGKGNVITKAQALDNKAGWAQIWNDKFAAAQTPVEDPIVPVGNGQSTTTSKDAMSRLKEADNPLDQGKAILDLMQG